MRKFIDILSEAPISIQQMDSEHGDPSRDSFEPHDRKIVTGKGLANIKRVWKSSVIDVDLYMLNIRVSPQDALGIALYGHLPLGLAAQYGWDSDDDHGYGTLREFEGKITPNPRNLTVLFTNNDGAERMPLTGWTIAHRIYHAFQIRNREGWAHNLAQSSNLINVMQDNTSALYSMFEQLSEIWVIDAELISKMVPTRACRDMNLVTQLEVLPEMFALYMLRGRLKLTRVTDTPHGKGWSLQKTNDEIARLEQNLNQNFALMINMGRGKVIAL